MNMDAVRSLRQRTGLGLAEIKKALEASGGDEEKAVRWLRENTKHKVEKPADPAAEGCVGIYRHHNGSLAAMVLLACKTDFTARNDEFVKLANALAMHVAAAKPRWVTRDEAAKEIADEREIQKARAAAEKIPAQRVDQVVEGRVCAWLRETVLMEQTFVDGSKTVAQMIQELSAKTGEPVVVRKIARLEVGV